MSSPNFTQSEISASSDVRSIPIEVVDDIPSTKGEKRRTSVLAAHSISDQDVFSRFLCYPPVLRVAQRDQTIAATKAIPCF